MARTSPVREGGDVIRVLSGTYTDATESFPLIVPSGVVVEKGGMGSMPNVTGGGPVPAGYGTGYTAAIVLEARAAVRSLEISNSLTAVDPGFHWGLLMAGDEAMVDGSSVYGSLSGGIRVNAGNDIRIHGTNIGGHLSGVGLHFAGGGVGGRVTSSNIWGNRIGVEYDAPGAALNGTSSLDRWVQIYDNSDTDVWVAPGIHVNARGCHWDHLPPQASTADVGGGIDIFHLDGPSGIDTSDFGPVVI